MSFTESVTTCFRKYVTFSGRAPRSEFWWFVLFMIIIFGGGEGFKLTTGSIFNVRIDGILSVIFLLPSIAVATRRLHDTGKSGWWQLISFTGIGWIFLIIWYAQKGEKGKNKYGPAPK